MGNWALGLLVLTALAPACGGGGTPIVGGDGGVIDATPSGDGCVPYAQELCVAGNVHYGDSCGNPLEQLEECVAPETCFSDRGACCRPPATGGFTGTGEAEGRAVVTFPAGASTFRMPFDIEAAPANGMDTFVVSAVYFDPPDPKDPPIRVVLYFHNELDTTNASLNRGVSLILYYTIDPTHVRSPAGGETIASDFYNVMIVRRNFDWGVGSFEAVFERNEAQGENDWYDFYVLYAGDQRQDVAGALLPRATAGVPASMNSALDLEIKIDTTINQYANVPSWNIRYRPLFDDAPPISGTSDYPGAGADEFADVNISYEDSVHEIRFELGKDTWRCDPEGILF